ncbi:hypothetical protein NCCP1664_08990 [Zafaria cholistanensis]|uniref:Septum formation-related domain-containing protein n=1 Tax=Zafaria cholistanensis TaxID=1682741 RepID=A0A5A7NQJ0_9MICC|nr:septum formation family protein [Zafaria cholistanensis]GER22402.1 hypothetical protein NCCP1664_08990 [Zafaria cholistanensis]
MEEAPDERPAPSPYQPARRADTKVTRRFGGRWGWIALGTAGVVLLVVFGAGRLSNATSPEPAVQSAVPRNPNPGIDGVVAASAPTSQFRVGDCLRGFSGPLEPATIVLCTASHDAQLIGLATLDDTPYPGDARTETKSEAACRAIELEATVALKGNWSYQFSRPSSGTWAAGDRTVACFLSLDEGTVDASLLPAADGPEAAAG